MTDPYYPRTPADFERGGGGSSNYSKIYRPEMVEHSSFNSVPLEDVITTQPQLQSYGSQISTGLPSSFGRPQPQPPPLPPPPPPLHLPSLLPQMMAPQMAPGVPLPGFELLETYPAFKIHNTEIMDGYSTCSPGYKIFSAQGDQVLRASSDTLFCPFDSKQKSVYVKDGNEDCIFQVKFTPSICECDSEEKRCFALFSPVFENPFGAILFESGQLKYSLKILNALEAETFAVQFIGSSDITIKGADGGVVAIINIHKERWSRPKFTLTLMEDVSTTNKALFIGCVITLDLVMCEEVCTRCICLAPIALACLTILGLTISSYTR